MKLRLRQLPAAGAMRTPIEVIGATGVFRLSLDGESARTSTVRSGVHGGTGRSFDSPCAVWQVKRRGVCSSGTPKRSVHSAREQPRCQGGFAAPPFSLTPDQTNAIREPNRTPYMTGQGGPKTLPAAYWQAFSGEMVAPAERRSGKPAAVSDRRLLIEQRGCQGKPRESGRKMGKRTWVVIAVVPTCVLVGSQHHSRL
jgi:hypothetical protein